MIINDPIADMLTRIRNALVAKHDSILVPASNEKKAVAKILLDEGFVKSVDLVEDGVQGAIKIGLKYDGRKSVITYILTNNNTIYRTVQLLCDISNNHWNGKQ